MILKKKKQATPKVKPVPFKLEFAILFLMELLPSRAPLCFRLRGKGTIQTAKNKTTKFILQFELLSTNYSKISCKMSYTPLLGRMQAPRYHI